MKKIISVFLTAGFFCFSLSLSVSAGGPGDEAKEPTSLTSTSKGEKKPLSEGERNEFYGKWAGLKEDIRPTGMLNFSLSLKKCSSTLCGGVDPNKFCYGKYHVDGGIVKNGQFRGPFDFNGPCLFSRNANGRPVVVVPKSELGQSQGQGTIPVTFVIDDRGNMLAGHDIPGFYGSYSAKKVK